MTEEHKKKISLALSGRVFSTEHIAKLMGVKIYKNCLLCDKIIVTTPSHKTKKFCSESCQYESYRKTIIKRCLHCDASYKTIPAQADRRAYCSHKCSMTARTSKGIDHPNWKGDNASYRSVHIGIQSKLGKASHCSINSNHVSTVYHWANISGEYKRDCNDWRSLCPKCNHNDGVKINERFKKRRSLY